MADAPCEMQIVADLLLSEARDRGWLPAAAEHIVLAPSLGFAGSSMATDLSLLSHLIRALQHRYPRALFGLATTGPAGPGHASQLRRSGLTALATELGLAIVDTSASACRLETAALPMPVNLPTLAFGCHTLITLTSLMLDPLRGLVGMLEHHKGLIPDLSQPRLRYQRPQLSELALKLWPPDLCILDARRVVIRGSSHLGHPSSLYPLGCLFAGSSPAAVDRRAADTLGLTARQAPILRDLGRSASPEVSEVILLGDSLGPVHGFHLDPRVGEERLLDAADRLGWRLSELVRRSVSLAQLPRIIDFVRRSRERP